MGGVWGAKRKRPSWWANAKTPKELEKERATVGHDKQSAARKMWWATVAGTRESPKGNTKLMSEWGEKGSPERRRLLPTGKTFGGGAGQLGQRGQDSIRTWGKARESREEKKNSAIGLGGERGNDTPGQIKKPARRRQYVIEQGGEGKVGPGQNLRGLTLTID